MNLKYKNDLTIDINSEKHSINLNYDRCFGRVIRKYNAMTDEVLDYGDLQNYGLRTLLVVEVLKKSETCENENVCVGDYVVVTASHPLQVNITLNYLIDDMGDEYCVIPEHCMMFKLLNPNSDDEIKILVDNFVRCELDEIINTDGTEAFELIKMLGTMTRFKSYKILDNNSNDVENGGFYIMDKKDMKNTFPLKNDEFITSVNNFKIRLYK